MSAIYTRVVTVDVTNQPHDGNKAGIQIGRHLMRISVWEQWSSNHSGSFCIIGRFQSVDAALAAEAELERSLMEVAAWHEQHAADFPLDQPLPPSPVELALAQHYDIQWNETTIDWLTSVDIVPRALVRIDDHVFVTSPAETWSWPTPFEHLLQRFGGKTQYVGEHTSGDLASQVWIRGRFPAGPDGDVLMQKLSAFFEDWDKRTYPYPPVPWVPKVGGRTPRWFFGYAGHGPDDYVEPFDYAHEEMRAAVRWSLSLGYEARNAIMRSSDQELRRRIVLAQLAEALEIEHMPLRGQVAWDEGRFAIDPIVFLDTSLAQGLRALLAYLADRGCAELTWKIDDQIE